MKDFLIVGAGLFGSVFARLATDAGYKCLVIDKRHHAGGNCHSEKKEGIDIHLYGPHIFHTSNTSVWSFVNRFAEFNNYIHSPKIASNGKLYSLPFSMNTFYELWGTISPEEAKQKIEAERWDIQPSNLEEQALSMVGSTIYDTLIKGYTEKQWGRQARELPASIIKRLPLRFTFDNNYFNDSFQGIPKQGYAAMFNAILEGIEIKLNTEFSPSFPWRDQAKWLVYTGSIDEYYDFTLGRLEYRTLSFEHETKPVENWQGLSQLNHASPIVPYSRTIEHKHFTKAKSEVTIITKEVPGECGPHDLPFYPIATSSNVQLFEQYKQMADNSGVVFGGRLAEYKYMDMHVVIESAMNKWRSWQRQFAKS
jgi:UDP-galactopyranose mutase